jgi:hypothetical protein
MTAYHLIDRVAHLIISMPTRRSPHNKAPLRKTLIEKTNPLLNRRADKYSQHLVDQTSFIQVEK